MLKKSNPVLWCTIFSAVTLFGCNAPGTVSDGTAQTTTTTQNNVDGSTTTTTTQVQSDQGGIDINVQGGGVDQAGVQIKGRNIDAGANNRNVHVKAPGINIEANDETGSVNIKAPFVNIQKDAGSNNVRINVPFVRKKTTTTDETAE